MKRKAPLLALSSPKDIQPAWQTNQSSNQLSNQLSNQSIKTSYASSQTDPGHRHRAPDHNHKIAQSMDSPALIIGMLPSRLCLLAMVPQFSNQKSTFGPWKPKPRALQGSMTCSASSSKHRDN